MARLIAEAPAQAVLDEFSSVVDRHIAQIGAAAFAKAWRRTAGRVVLISCHYDILDWVQPDWVFDTSAGQYERGRLWRRPKIQLDIWQTGWDYWHLFEPHHYLKLPRMAAATNYVATVDNELVAHVAVSTRSKTEARACRLVVMPEWQGAGVGIRFLDAVCERWLYGQNRYALPMRTLFHTSHPGLAAALRRSIQWTQVSATLIGGNKARSAQSMRQSRLRTGRRGPGRAMAAISARCKALDIWGRRDEGCYCGPKVARRAGFVALPPAGARGSGRFHPGRRY